MTHTLGGLFASPYVAAPFGIVLGVALVAVSRSSSRLVTPDDPSMGMIKVTLMMMLRMVLAILALLAYFAWARSGFIAFALSMVISFIGGLGYEAYRAASPSTSRSTG